MEDFVHLHVHTHYSLLDGMSKVPNIVDKAIADGMKGIALTDHGNMFGMKELFDYCCKVNGKRKKEGLEPFKPIFGCEMYVARRNKEDMSEKTDRSGNHLIVLAKNANGYRNLIKLILRKNILKVIYASYNLYSLIYSSTRHSIIKYSNK